MYLIITQSDRPDLTEVIKSKFPDDYRVIAPAQWLVSADMTPQSLCTQLGANEGAFGRIMVSAVGSYYGWHEKDLWNWLSLKEKK